ncbi:polysaccharide deacetylase family protein [Herbaspirillum rubrisubalbicans]|uniref:polysaccharide deacetylase family protein n=1 Tax=Herbaspirillum rubrisubalbicans TaxID=80842 RepID=UPI0021ABEF1D|nr:polysaccharide deacetylase family protein [Herbaspirillum rubrisubalbicans]
MSDINDPMLTLRDRISYQPITQRPRFVLPGNARVAVWTIVNIEHWLPQSAMPRTVLPPPMGQPLLPDVPNWCWHEYGMRVGYWRLLEVLEAYGIKATLALNGSTCEVYPAACEAALRAGWEFMGHGLVQKPMHRVEDQAGDIRKTIQAIRAFTGAAPRGWESPGLTESADTLDLLAQAGIEYVADWVLDDQPVTLRTCHGDMVSVPYTVELNDVVMSAIQLHRSDEILRRGRDQFDCLYREGVQQPRVMAISVHPYLTGTPHRIRYLDALYNYIAEHEQVLFCTGGEILDIYRAQAQLTEGLR